MKLYINQEEISFSLEKEKTCRDVIGSLDQWISQQGWSMTGAYLNGTDLYQIPDWENWDLDQLKTLEIETALPQDKFLLDLGMVHDFFGLMEQALRALTQGVNTKAFWNLKDDFHVLQGNLKGLLGSEFTPIEENLQFLTQLFQTQNEVALDEALNSILTIRQAVETAISRIKNHQNLSKKNLEALKDLLPQLSQVSLLWQTSEKDKAMNIIKTLMEVLSPLVELMAQDDFRAVLNQIHEALAQEDLILTGDLLEYELSPRIQEYLDQI